MRNLKKVLSLALALVMLLGMMVVGASAAYKDEASIGDDYKEAVDVLTAVKVVQGRTASSFQPELTLTRAEAAMIITRAILGRSVADALAKNTNSVVFSDVQGHWAAGVVDYCYDRGIIRGTSATTFNPERTVSSMEFTAMMLRALGLVDADNAAGGNWMTETIAVAAQKGLSDSTLVVSNARMKRQEAAQMAFNGILYSPSGEKTYQVGNETFSNAADAYFYQQGLKGEKPAIKVITAKDSLAATVHNLTSGTKDDGFGHTVKTWKVDGKEVWAASTYTSTADKTFTYTKATANKDFKDSDFAASVDLIVDGEPQNAITEDYADKVVEKTNDSAVVELYKNSDGKYNKVIVVNTYAGLVTVNEAKKETARSITIKGVTDLKNLETEDWEKDQVVLYNKSYVTNNDTSAKYNIKNVVAADSVEGEMTSYTKKDPVKYTIAGTAYELSTGAVVKFNDKALKDVTKGTYYLGTNGKIVYAVPADGTTTNTGNYAVIASAHAELKEAVWPATEKSVTLKVKALLSDGNLGIYTVDGVKYVAAEGDNKAKGELKIGDATAINVLKDDGSAAKEDANVLALLGGIYDYTLDGEKIKLNSKVADLTASPSESGVAAVANGSTDGSDEITKTSIVINPATGTNKPIINNKTVFVLLSEDGKAGKMVTGAAALEGTTIQESAALAVVDVNKGTSSTTLTAKVVFAKSTNFVAAATATGNYAYLTGDYSRTTSKDADGKYTFTYTGISSDGEEVTLTKKAASDPGVKEGVYAINNDVTLGTVHKAQKVTVTAYGDGVLTVKSNAGDGQTAFTVPEAAKIVIAEDGAELEAGAQVYVVWNATTKTQADIIFVLKAEK